MVIIKNITSYLIARNASLGEALKKINSNHHRIVYLVDDKNYLCGSLTDGDIRRWLLTSVDINLDTGIEGFARQPCFSLSESATLAEIENSISLQIQSIPLVDTAGHIVAIAESGNAYFEIGEKRISSDDSVFIIAEIGNNHQGDINLAKRLVELAAESGANCAKFQMRNLPALYRNDGISNDASADLGAQYTLNLLEKFQLTDAQLFEVFDYCKLIGIQPLCTPWDAESLRLLEKYGMPAYKVASADFTNHQLLEQLARTGKLLICSTGMSTEDEIKETVLFLKKRSAQFVLLHCNSAYPAPFKDVNLKYLRRLMEISGSIVGYSGHERGWSVPVGAVALGAKIIEKHFTIDRMLEGNDHKVSLLPDEFQQMVTQIRQIEDSLGTDSARKISQGEMMNRENLAKSLIARKNILEGEVITESDIDVKSPGQGIQPNRIRELIGKKAIRNLVKGDFFFESDITGVFNKKSKYRFNRPYGIPVRYHDFKKLTSNINLDFVEFHLSYRDLDINLDEYLSTNEVIGYAVHSPELFEGDHLIDLTSDKDEYWNRSIKEIQRVINHANKLKKYFKKTQEPIIIINAGGASSDDFLSQSTKRLKYERMKQAFHKIDQSGVKIAIQTMPPYPWHFGGQHFHNIFVNPEEIADFCNETGIHVCFDVSHSAMSCNYYGWDLIDFTKKIAPHVVHLHIVDAVGIDGEGIQIGCGDVNFKRLVSCFKEHLPSIQFIPEVWQGHKDRGAGFWYALGYLENEGL